MGAMWISEDDVHSPWHAHNYVDTGSVVPEFAFHDHLQILLVPHLSS